MPELLVGIDLGTSTSAVGWFHETDGHIGDVRLVQGDFGYNWIRSSVLYDVKHSVWLAGAAAWNQRKLPDKAPYYVVSAKRHLGIDRVIPLNGSSTVTMAGRIVDITPQLLLSKVLDLLKGKIENLAPSYSIKGAVVAIPMIYMSHEATLTREAVDLAGIKLLGFVQEPTAAALCYVHESPEMRELRKNELILVFDFGGGTFDLTVFQLTERTGDELYLDVKSTAGIRQLGGDDVDILILRYLQEKGLKLPDPLSPHLRSKVMDEIERLKTTLSNIGSSAAIETGVSDYVKARLSSLDDALSKLLGSYEEKWLAGLRTEFVNGISLALEKVADADITSDFSVHEGKISYTHMFSVAEFIGLVFLSDITAKLADSCRKIRRRVGTPNRIMLVGGSSHLPHVKPLLRMLFGGDVRITSALNQQESVVRGAVYRAAQLAGRPTGQARVTLRNHGVLSHDFGLIVGKPGEQSFHPMIRQNEPYPMARPKVQTFTVESDGPLIVECAQGDASSELATDRSSHTIFDKIPHDGVPPGTKIQIGFRANNYGEIEFSSSWPGGKVEPRPLRPKLDR